MAIIRVYYEYHDEALIPFTLMLHCRPGELRQDQDSFYVPLWAPFKRHLISDLDTDLKGISVLLEDLIRHPDKPNAFGISLIRIKERYGLNDEFEDDLNFIVHMCDIEEILQLDIRDYFNYT